MALAKMQKVAVITHSSFEEELIEFLHTEGVLEITKEESTEKTDHTQIEFTKAELAFAIKTLKEYASKQTKAAANKLPTTEEIEKAVTHTDFQSIIDELHSLEEADTKAQRAITEQKLLVDQLGAWKNLPYKPTEEYANAFTEVQLGTIPQTTYDAFKKDLQNELPKTALELVQTNDGNCSVVAHVWKQDADAFEHLATKYGWTNVVLPSIDENVQDILNEATIEVRKQQSVIEKNKAKRQAMSVELPNLLKVQTYLRWNSEKQQARESLTSTKDTVTLFGWMPLKRVSIVESKLHNLHKAVAVLRIKPDKGEVPPVLLQNNKLVTPFQSVTGLYGLPLANEMDPTASLSPFFVLFFGLCLTDAGYGAIIALIFGTVLYKTRKSVEEATLIWLLFIGGIVTFLVSIPFGGWFGLTPEQVPAFLTKQTESGLFFRGQIWNLSTQSGITFLQNLSLVLGLTHLFFGMMLAGIHKWIHGNKAQALWQDFTSHLLLGAALFMAFSPDSLSSVATYVLYVVLALNIWGKGYGTVWYLRPIMGVLGFVNFCISLLSNSLSYLRILALGLVTGAIAGAVNQVAIEFGKLFPIYIAIPIIIVIFLVGHLVSIALNTLGSFIHSGRLQFIEFFSQFFEGGGRSFSPFRRINS